MRILILSQTFPLTPRDSCAHFLYDFAAGLKSVKQQVFVLLPYHPKLKINQFKGLKVSYFKYIWPERLHLLGFGQTLINDQDLHWYVYLLAPFYLFFGFIALWRLVKRERIKIINAHWLIPNGVLAALVSKVTGIPLVITLPGSDVYLAKKNPLYYLLAKFALKQTREVVSNSPQLLADLKVKGKVISYGVPIHRESAEVGMTFLRTSQTRPDGTVGAQTRWACSKSMPPRRLMLSAAGRQVEKKGFAFLQSICPDIEIISDLPIDDFRQKLRSVDIFIAPSIRDSRGNLDDASLVVLEAMAAGCTVITSDLPGYRRMIRSGQNGLLVSPNVKKAWVAAIGRCKKSKTLRQKLGRNAQQTIKNYFTLQKIARKYYKLFLATTI
jgi:glycosyltransferase involved in cell wall biosynthesis